MKPYALSRAFALVLVLVLGTLAPAPALAGPRDVSEALAPICGRNDVPGIAAALVLGDGQVVSLGAAGIRKRGAPDRVTAADRFHIGSCTKSMTATLAGMLVDEKKLSWTTTVGDVFGAQADLRDRLDAAWRPVTLEQLLTNRSGAPAGLDQDGLWGRLWAHRGTPAEARRKLVAGVITRPPEAPPGSKFIYSNGGFAIAGAMIESRTGEEWESLLTRRLFDPLEMRSAGFGAPGERGRIDEPRGHTERGDAVEPGPGSDNPNAIGPAGTVHVAVADWAKYAALHVTGERRLPGQNLLSPGAFKKLHAPPPGAEPPYAMGWGVTERPWGGGRVLTHNGSNTMWFAVLWIAPERDFAVLAACNQGGARGAKATDEAVWALIQDHLAIF